MKILAQLTVFLLGVLASRARTDVERGETSSKGIDADKPVVTRRSYDRLLRLWTSGVRDYHSLLSAYLTANSIFVAVMSVLISRQSTSMVFSIVIAVLSLFGILMTAQMAIMLGRFSAQNGLWAWKLRGIEQHPDWQDERPLTDLHKLREGQDSLVNTSATSAAPAKFQTTWALRTQRQWWAHRAISFPWFFGSVYAVFLIWSLTELIPNVQ